MRAISIVRVDTRLCCISVALLIPFIYTNDTEVGDKATLFFPGNKLVM